MKDLEQHSCLIKRLRSVIRQYLRLADLCNVLSCLASQHGDEDAEKKF
jgi:hypothetical protein